MGETLSVRWQRQTKVNKYSKSPGMKSKKLFRETALSFALAWFNSLYSALHKYSYVVNYNILSGSICHLKIHRGWNNCGTTDTAVHQNNENLSEKKLIVSLEKLHRSTVQEGEYPERTTISC